MHSQASAHWRYCSDIACRHADYESGSSPEEDAFFEDATAIDFKTRRVCGPIAKKEGGAEGPDAFAKGEESFRPPLSMVVLTVPFPQSLRRLSPCLLHRWTKQPGPQTLPPCLSLSLPVNSGQTCCQEQHTLHGGRSRA